MQRAAGHCRPREGHRHDDQRNFQSASEAQDCERLMLLARRIEDIVESWPAGRTEASSQHAGRSTSTVRDRRVPESWEPWVAT
jgi:hypothetical protein